MHVACLKKSWKCAKFKGKIHIVSANILHNISHQMKKAPFNSLEIVSKVEFEQQKQFMIMQNLPPFFTRFQIRLSVDPFWLNSLLILYCTNMSRCLKYLFLGNS